MASRRASATAPTSVSVETGTGDIGFAGFPKAGLAFLRGLEKNNDRAWFNARKDIFKTDVSEPFDLLIADVAARLHALRIPLAPKARNPAFRIYRDVRFTPDKRPYNTWISTAFYHRGVATGAGVLYVQLAPKESFAAAGFYQPDKPALDALRKAVVDDSSRFLKIVRAPGVELMTDDSLVRVPPAFARATGTAVEAHVKLKSFVMRRSLATQSLSEPGLVEEIAAFAKASLPLLNWGWKIVSSV